MEETVKLKFDAIWKTRELEMKSFGERALYVWGFLTLCYGAYTFLLYQVVSAFLLEIEHELVHPVGTFVVFNGFMMALVIGIFVLSALWICLIKGANAWAERTDWIAECFTHRYLRSTPIEGACCERVFTSSFPEIQKNRNCNFCKGNPSHVCLLGVFPSSSSKQYFPKWDKSIFTSHGGVYSPNKIYLFIAQVSMALGFVLAICHAVLFCIPFASIKAGAHWLCRDSWIVGAIALCLLVVLPVITIIGNRLKTWSRLRLKSITIEDDMSVLRAISGDK